MRSVGWLVLGLGACNIVDETGYLCPLTGVRVATPEDCPDEDPTLEDAMDADTAPESEADEAGGQGGGGGVFYTAEVSLSEVPGTIFVVGGAGAVAPGAAVTLRVAGGADAAAAVFGTSFVGQTQATLGAQVEVLATGADPLELELERSLEGSALSTLVVPPSAPEDTDLPGGGGDGALREIDIAPSATGITPPYLAFDPELGSAMVVTGPMTSPTLTVREGDRVCFADISEKQAGLSVCAPVR